MSDFPPVGTRKHKADQRTSVNCFIPQPMRTNPPRQTLYHNHCSGLLQRFPKPAKPEPNRII
jgi:hypothetical protein